MSSHGAYGALVFSLLLNGCAGDLTVASGGTRGEAALTSEPAAACSSCVEAPPLPAASSWADAVALGSFWALAPAATDSPSSLVLHQRERGELHVHLVDAARGLVLATFVAPDTVDMRQQGFELLGNDLALAQRGDIAELDVATVGDDADHAAWLVLVARMRDASPEPGCSARSCPLAPGESFVMPSQVSLVEVAGGQLGWPPGTIRKSAVSLVASDAEDPSLRHLFLVDPHAGEVVVWATGPSTFLRDAILQTVRAAGTRADGVLDAPVYGEVRRRVAAATTTGPIKPPQPVGPGGDELAKYVVTQALASTAGPSCVH